MNTAQILFYLGSSLCLVRQLVIILRMVFFVKWILLLAAGYSGWPAT
jgi:hypothetical protein